MGVTRAVGIIFPLGGVARVQQEQQEGAENIHMHIENMVSEDE